VAYRLASERITVEMPDGPTIEVERLGSWPLQQQGAALALACLTAKAGNAQLAALHEAYAFFVAEAQPTWDLMDHRGPIPPLVGGLLRLPHLLALALIEGWLDTLEPKSTAADVVMPEGEARDQVNAALRAKRKS
jgi:hypothetical protein